MPDYFRVGSSLAGDGHWITVPADTPVPKAALAEMGFRYDPGIEYDGEVRLRGWHLRIPAKNDLDDPGAASRVLEVWDKLVRMGLEARGSLTGIRVAQMRRSHAE